MIGEERSTPDLARERLAAWFADVAAAEADLVERDWADDLDMPPGVG